MAAPEEPTDLRPYPVQITAPDISGWRAGNTGVDWFHRLESGAPGGPHAMITAVTHGNELCGAIVLDALLRTEFRPLCGTLTLGFCNIEAYRRFDPAAPIRARFVDEDMNRLWDAATLDGPGGSLELERCREIRPLLERMDYLLDIHSMQHPTAPLMLAGPLAKGRRLAEMVGVPPHIMMDPGHADGRRMRDYGAFADPTSPRAALLVECGQHWARRSVAVARDSTTRFLRGLGMLGSEFVFRAREQNPEPPAQTVIEVTGPLTVKTDAFAFVKEYKGMEVIAKAGTLLAKDGDEPIRTPYDACILIMPSRHLEKGKTAVRFGKIID